MSAKIISKKIDHVQPTFDEGNAAMQLNDIANFVRNILHNKMNLETDKRIALVCIGSADTNNNSEGQTETRGLAVAYGSQEDMAFSICETMGKQPQLAVAVLVATKIYMEMENQHTISDAIIAAVGKDALNEVIEEEKQSKYE